MHPCPGNWVAIGRTVVYNARADQAFSAGIKCRHWRLDLTPATPHVGYLKLDRDLWRREISVSCVTQKTH